VNQQRPYGYVVDENGHLKPHPTEAPIVRRMKDDFLGGASLRGIARWLNDEGVKPPGVVHAEDARAAGRRAKGPLGDSWYATTVRKVLSQPAIAALVSHNRKVLYEQDGQPISAGEGIATMAERARILAELERRSVVAQMGCVERAGKRTGAGRPAEHLLVGFVRCGECGGAAVRQPSKGVYAFRWPGSATERAVEGRRSPRGTLRMRCEPPTRQARGTGTGRPAAGRGRPAVVRAEAARPGTVRIGRLWCATA
jgi:Recombinase